MHGYRGSAMRMPLAIIPLLIVAGATAADVAVRVDPAKASTWTIDPMMFGRFFEEHGGDVEPGVCEQYLANPSFEPWFTGGKEKAKKTRIVFRDTPAEPGIAYPWQALRISGNAGFTVDSEHRNSAKSQRIVLEGPASEAGVRHRVALPDGRVRRYRARFFAKCEGDIAVEARLLAGDEQRLPLARASATGVGGEWREIAVDLELPSALATRHLGHFGVAEFAIVGTGTGTLWVDQATLVPADAVEGVYNPTTIANAKALGITGIRWPGGNYTSGYHWKDGIGPRDERRTVPNRHWSGLDTNEVGTDEWMRFCELAGLTPIMGVGFGEVTAEEAADWVEYCNGAPESTMGALRARNGHREPYGVRYWGIGNEVWGPWQIGHTDAATYAAGYLRMAEAMLAKDPSIKLIADVPGPYWPTRGAWCETLMAVAGAKIDFVDVHHYANGPQQPDYDKIGADTVLRSLLCSDRLAKEYCDDLRKLFSSRPETSGIRVVFYEWAIIPHVRKGAAATDTFANALGVAVHYDEFIRSGDLVRQLAFHDFTFAEQPIPPHAAPPDPRSRIASEYAALAGGRVVDLAIDCPSYAVPRMGKLRAREVGHIDGVAALAPDGRLHVCLVNRSTDAEHRIRLECAGKPSAGGTVRLFTSADPVAPQRWETSEPVFSIEEQELRDGGMLVMPRLSFAHLILPASR
jgi:alpha-L-arabinofuranosidase